MLHAENTLAVSGSVYEIRLSRNEYQLLIRLRQLIRQHGDVVLLVESNRETLRWRKVGPAEG